ncbi:MAG: SurA N-terminal domain-containing protein, partial [bacterium]
MPDTGSCRPLARIEERAHCESPTKCAASFSSTVAFIAAIFSACAAVDQTPLVYVDGAPITMEDVRHTPEFVLFFDQYKEQHGDGPATNEKLRDNGDFQTVVERLIEDRAILKVALSKGLALQPASVQDQMEKDIRGSFANRADFLAWLSKKGLNEGDYRRHVEADMRRNQVLRFFLNPSPIEVVKYCEGDRGYFHQQFVTSMKMKETEFSCKNPIVQA